MKLALKALVEVVEGSSKNIEVAVVEKEGALRFLTGAHACVWVGGRAGEWASGRGDRSRRRIGRQGTAWLCRTLLPTGAHACCTTPPAALPCPPADEEVDALVKEIEEEKAAAAPQRPAAQQ